MGPTLNIVQGGLCGRGGAAAAPRGGHPRGRESLLMGDHGRVRGQLHLRHHPPHPRRSQVRTGRTSGSSEVGLNLSSLLIGRSSSVASWQKTMIDQKDPKQQCCKAGGAEIF